MAMIVILILGIFSSCSFGCDKDMPLFAVINHNGKIVMYSNSGSYAPDQKMWTFMNLDEQTHRSFKISDVDVATIDGAFTISSDGKLFLAPSEIDMNGKFKHPVHHMPYDTKFGIYYLNEETLQYVADELGYGCGGTSLAVMKKRHPDWMM